jgi:DNA-binding PadR family transcriptional regulator
MFNFDWAKRTHKGLRGWILHIVNDGPKSGAEIMDIMEGRLQGWWRPSPGSIYPLLDKMVEEGTLSRSDEKKYSLTKLGREEFEQPFPWLRGIPTSGSRSIEGVLGELSSYISYLEDVSHSKDGRLSGSQQQIKELSRRLAKLEASS